MFPDKHKATTHRSVDEFFCAMVFGVEPALRFEYATMLNSYLTRMTVGFVIPSHPILKRLDVSIALQDVTVTIWGFTLSHVPSVAMQP